LDSIGLIAFLMLTRHSLELKNFGTYKLIVSGEIILAIVRHCIKKSERGEYGSRPPKNMPEALEAIALGFKTTYLCNCCGI